MAFTATDVTSIETAIKALVNGSRVVECSINGDLVQYHRTDIGSMMKLRDTMIAEIAAATAAASTTSNRGRTRIAVTTKGY